MGQADTQAASFSSGQWEGWTQYISKSHLQWMLFGWMDGHFLRQLESYYSLESYIIAHSQKV